MLICSALVYDGAEPVSETGIDERWFLKIASGDKAAFGLLYEQAGSSIYAYALSMLRNREEAEDARQETFLKVRSAAHLYQFQGKPMAWLLTITRNICLMRLRQKKHTPFSYGEQDEKTAGFDQISDIEDRLVLKKAFQVLAEDELQIIMLHAVSGMKHREIGEAMAMPLSTVLSKYRRGLGKSRRELGGLA
jgi:RNA polymerase sigma-70 factor (ECF subfamily)